ncbi:hypothetical protein MIT9_P2040 [Methylomarinovum caldicuralii]|uniref:Uncharacterized protein n=1 Tax=Methylomarinovum caldicuralii TaxID=438856 RepID=A0AAU9C8W0_9GAMM|nr:hypothetical protein [Methylomarinovum caldicuralii]BCX82454.1 hypothetical protein MIT9_P2040 [Methylomarinovum caldicuralii]
MNAISDIYKIKIRPEEFLAHPALTATFVVLFFGLTFARLPALLYMLMLALEVYIAMFFGGRFAQGDQGSEAGPVQGQPSEETS